MVLVAVGAALLLTTTACSGNAGTPTDTGSGPGATTAGTAPAEATSPPSGSLTFAGWQWLEPGRGDTLWAGVQQYTKANPGATITKEATAYGQFADKLNTELGGGTGPDVFEILDFQFASLAKAGLLEPLDDAVKGAALNSSNDALKVDGKQLGVTWEQVNYALIWNKNLLTQAGLDPNKPPTTVDQLISEAQTCKQKTGADGFGVRHQISELDGWFQDFNSWTYGQGGQWSDGKNLTLASPENVAGVNAYKKVYDSGIIPIGDDASTMRSKFNQGNMCFMIDNSGATLSMATSGTIKGTDIGAGAMPFPEPGSHQMLMLAVNANSPNKELAKDFIKWFVSKDGQAAIRPGLGASTMATDEPMPADFLAANPWAPGFAALTGSKSALIPGFEPDTKAIMKEVITAVEKVITQNADPETALKDAQTTAEAGL